ncbi:hypothetical protein BgiBS90_027070 [Biomphalaria glabrata]|nr:hypothetical protein BgiBS90_027070 [Biomphalaria glabrata]
MGAGKHGQRPGKEEAGDAAVKLRESDERTCLRSKKEREDRVCLIQSRLALTILTRAVFLILSLSCVAVITTSIWLMLNCRENFARVRPMIPEHALFCTNMGMPALFACCTFLFTIFGLGCTGRRLTGYALIIISSVEILQSVTTLAFYKCNTVDHQDILDTVNSSLTSCHKPMGFAIPLFYVPSEVSRQQNKSLGNGAKRKRRAALDPQELSAMSRQTDSYVHESMSDFRKEPTTYLPNLVHTRQNVTSIPFQPSIEAELIKAESEISRYSKNTDSGSIVLKQRGKKLIEEFNNKMRVQVEPGKKTQTPKTPGQEKFKVKGHTTSSNDQCSQKSPFFAQLGLRIRTSELHECLAVCQTYFAVCPPSRQADVSASKLTNSDRATAPSGFTRDRASFDKVVLHCGDHIKEHVNKLCFYNDEIIIPISICAPTFYICLSLCFIYFCRCDRRLKEFGPIETASKERSDPPKKWTWRSLPCCTGADYSDKSSPWSCAGLKASLPLTTGMTKGSHGAFSTSIEGSNSTHVLLQMREMPDLDNAGATVSQGASRDTLNTLLSEELSATASQ